MSFWSEAIESQFNKILRLVPLAQDDTGINMFEKIITSFKKVDSEISAAINSFLKKYRPSEEPPLFSAMLPDLFKILIYALPFLLIFAFLKFLYPYKKFFSYLLFIPLGLAIVCVGMIFLGFFQLAFTF